MNLKIKKREDIYDINLIPITQLCGKAIQTKTFIINSLEKYFSASKYMEYEKDMIDNILIDDELLGHKYFDVTVIRSRHDLINQLKLTKTGKVKKYLDKLLEDYYCQFEIEKIQQSLNIIFEEVNEKFLNGNSGLKIRYREEKLFDMIQTSEVCACDDRMIEELSNVELIIGYLKLIEEEKLEDGNKAMIIFENLDHLVSFSEYFSIMEQLKIITDKSDLWCIVTTSLEGYTYFDREFFEGINCVNDIVYSMPEYIELKEYIEFNYPVNKKLSEALFENMLMSAVHNIGIDYNNYEIRGTILERLLNKSICMNVDKNSDMTALERNFL